MLKYIVSLKRTRIRCSWVQILDSPWIRSWVFQLHIRSLWTTSCFTASFPFTCTPRYDCFGQNVSYIFFVFVCMDNCIKGFEPISPTPSSWNPIFIHIVSGITQIVNDCHVYNATVSWFMWNVIMCMFVWRAFFRPDKRTSHITQFIIGNKHAWKSIHVSFNGDKPFGCILIPWLALNHTASAVFTAHL